MPARVMIVDDAEFQRHVLGKHIAAAGGEVIAGIASAQEAVQRHPALKPDVIFIDLALPAAGALSAIRAIREASPQARIAVLASSTYRDEVPAALEAGAMDYLPKPFNAEQVRAVLERLPLVF